MTMNELGTMLGYYATPKLGTLLARTTCIIVRPRLRLFGANTLVCCYSAVVRGAAAPISPTSRRPFGLTLEKKSMGSPFSHIGSHSSRLSRTAGMETHICGLSNRRVVEHAECTR